VARRAAVAAGPSRNTVRRRAAVVNSAGSAIAQSLACKAGALWVKIGGGEQTDEVHFSGARRNWRARRVAPTMSASLLDRQERARQ
jgi:hypothetical protein